MLGSVLCFAYTFGLALVLGKVDELLGLEFEVGHLAYDLVELAQLVRVACYEVDCFAYFSDLSLNFLQISL